MMSDEGAYDYNNRFYPPVVSAATFRKVVTVCAQVKGIATP